MIFFFSSRRRHTRCLSDWSSDVCSSDLAPLRLCVKKRNLRTERPLRPTSRPIQNRQILIRSEERRVGRQARTTQGLKQSRKREKTQKTSSICNGELQV